MIRPNKRQCNEAETFEQAKSSISKNLRCATGATKTNKGKESPNENFLYGSNRGENSIVVFKRNKKDGSLKKVQSISCHGNWPRNFAIGPEGNFLLVANQRSNNIAVFLVDKATGELTYVYDIEAANPSCLKF